MIDDAIGKLLRIAEEKRFVVLCDFLIWPGHSETVCFEIRMHSINNELGINHAFT